MGRPGNELITFLDLKTIRTSKHIRKSKISITEASLQDMSKSIKKFKNVPYEGSLRKRYKHMPTDSYLCLSRYLPRCMMRNPRDTVITQKTSTKKISNSKMSMQNILNSHVCSTEDSKNKGSLRTISNQKALTSTRALWMIVNQKG